MLHKCTSGPFSIVSYWRRMMSYNHQNREVSLQKLTIFLWWNLLTASKGWDQSKYMILVHTVNFWQEVPHLEFVSATHDTFCGTTFAISGKCRIKETWVPVLLWFSWYNWWIPGHQHTYCLHIHSLSMLIVVPNFVFWVHINPVDSPFF